MNIVNRNTTLLLLGFIIALIIKPGASLAQNGFSVGGKTWGLGFGSFSKYTGIKLSVIDTCGLRTNGAHFSAINKYSSDSCCTNTGTNGIDFSLINFDDRSVNVNT